MIKSGDHVTECNKELVRMWLEIRIKSRDTLRRSLRDWMCYMLMRSNGGFASYIDLTARKLVLLSLLSITGLGLKGAQFSACYSPSLGMQSFTRKVLKLVPRLP